MSFVIPNQYLSFRRTDLPFSDLYFVLLYTRQIPMGSGVKVGGSGSAHVRLVRGFCWLFTFL